MASAQAALGPLTLRLMRQAAFHTAKTVRTKLFDTTRPLLGRTQPTSFGSLRYGRQPIHPAAFLRQSKHGFRRHFHGALVKVRALRTYVYPHRASSLAASRCKLPISNTSRLVARFSGRAPFASTLRPNLTGGVLSRSAGGYSIGGGARYFSHTPASSAQVVHNVSQAVRAFFLSGQKIRYDGTGSNGERRFRAISPLQDTAMRRVAEANQTKPGAFIDFSLFPSIKALVTPSTTATAHCEKVMMFEEDEHFQETLSTDGLLDLLSADIDRAWRNSMQHVSDLKRLSRLGDLPLVLREKSVLRVLFPGVDSLTVQQLCDDLGVRGGVVGEDVGLDPAIGASLALRFPFAPDIERTLTSPGGSSRSLEGHEYDDDFSLTEDSLVRAAFADEQKELSTLSETQNAATVSMSVTPEHGASNSYDGLEGIYHFLEECDRGIGKIR